MDALQHYAMARARAGDWGVANAMELVELHKQDSDVVLIAQHDGRAIIGIGYLPDLAETSHTYTRDCGECEGDGNLEVEGASGRTRKVECPWCCGTGEEDCEDCDDDDDDEGGDESPSVQWQTLDGEPVTLADDLEVLARAMTWYNAVYTVNYHRAIAEALYPLERLPREPLYWWPDNR